MFRSRVVCGLLMILPLIGNFYVHLWYLLYARVATLLRWKHPNNRSIIYTVPTKLLIVLNNLVGTVFNTGNNFNILDCGSLSRCFQLFEPYELYTMFSFMILAGETCRAVIKYATLVSILLKYSTLSMINYSVLTARSYLSTWLTYSSSAVYRFFGRFQYYSNK